MEQRVIEELADKLHSARTGGYEIEKISADTAELSMEDAYTIQEEGIALREKNGEKIVGSKMGLTSKAKREQMDLHEAIYGILTDKMEVEDGGAYLLSGQIHPKIEPEIAFKFNKDLKQSATREEIIEACSEVFAALEILDSRYKNFKYFSLPDVVADNSSSSHFIVAKKGRALKGFEVGDLSMKMLVNGEVATEGSSQAISGHPIESMIQQVELFHKRGKYIKAGDIVLAGAATTAVKLEDGMNVSLEVEGLPSVSIKVKG